MGKDFSLVTSFVLKTAGFTNSTQKISKDAKLMATGVNQSMSSIGQSVGVLTTSALPAFGQQFGALGGIMGSVKTAILGLVPAVKSVTSAIIATGIGAVIVGIAVAVMGLISWMKRTDEGGDVLRQTMLTIKAVIEVVLEKLSLLGSALVKVFKGDFRGASEDIKSAFTGWGEAIKTNIEAAKQVEDISEKLDDVNVTYALKRARIEERISELQAKARDEESYSAKERLKFNEQLKKANEELYFLAYNKGQLELDVIKKEYEIGAKNDDTRQKINDKEAELIGLRITYNQSLKETIKLNNKLAEDAERQVQREKEQAEYKKNPLQTLQSKGTGLIPQIKAPDLIPGNFDKLLSKWDELKTKITESQDAMNLFSSGIQGFGEAMTAMIAGQKGSFKAFVGEMLAGIRRVLLAHLAEGIIAAYTGQATKGLKGLAIASGIAIVLSGIYQRYAGSFATGGITPFTGMALVGERGPELMQLPGGTRIYNNSQTNRIMNSMLQGEVTFRIENDALVGVLNNGSKKNNAMG